MSFRAQGTAAPKNENEPSRPPEDAAPIPQALWAEAQQALSWRCDEGTYRAYLAALEPLALDWPPGAERVICWLAHPNAYAAEWVGKRLAGLVERALEECWRVKVEVRVVCRAKK